MYQRKYWRVGKGVRLDLLHAGLGVVGTGLGKYEFTYLTCADFVECDERESLREHSAREIPLREPNRDKDGA